MQTNPDKPDTESARLLHNREDSAPRFLFNVQATS